ncbi:MAG TPA: hypothetical protein PL017_05160 [Tenuifilaceae bacterium]|nr:hypothetical protein [Tenuifilaceae bacterium]HPE18095.1 hypothetical protein [Tenuifilaceae bacterium]HPJ45465.1 hypothetical protein [Tenuifilaceae bacterium]HPQ34082.1 hypothetical protein [Tenuifilaceae bacterium]HRX68023.1 hypothetical protein [Tenuifilaceae bacterium]
MKTFRTISYVLIISLFLFSCDLGDLFDPYDCNVDIDELDFTFGIDYSHPEVYLVPGEQSDLTNENFEAVTSAVGTSVEDIDDVLRVCHWINQNFTFENAGGSMAGVNTADELFEIRTFYGCHSLALIISSVLRKYGVPAVMIETADIQWAYDYRDGATDYFKGHVMSEIFLNGSWILLDNNCTYVDEYQYDNPYISVQNPDEKGLFVFAKGVDIWDYRNGNDNFTYDKMIDFSANLSCYDELFYTVTYTWEN